MITENNATMNMNRRGILLGLASALAAPAIVHAGTLMPIKAIKSDLMTVIIEGYDVFGHWPRNSYFLPEFNKV